MKTGQPMVLSLLLSLSWAASADEPTPIREPAGKYAAAGPEIEIIDLIGRVAKRSNRQFVVDARVRGAVPLAGLDPERVDYTRLLAILRINQFAAYEADGLVNIVPDAIARQLPVPVTNAVSSQTPDDELVTVLLRAKNVCAVATVPVLRPLMPQAAHLAALPQTNSLVISDRAGNARRIADLFGRLDRLAPEKQGCTEQSGK